MFKLRAVIHCPGFLHGTSCTCLAAVSLAIYQCDGAKPRQCGIRHWLNCFYQSAPYRNGGYQSAGIAGVSGIIAAVDGSHSQEKFIVPYKVRKFMRKKVDFKNKTGL